MHLRLVTLCRLRWYGVSAEARKRAAQKLGRLRWRGVSARARTAHAKLAVRGREAKCAQRRIDIESRLSANVKEGMLEAAYRYSKLKISNAYYKFGYLYIDELCGDRKRLSRWNGRQVSKSLRAMLPDSALVDLIPVEQRLSFLRGLIGRSQRDDTESRLSANVKEGLLEVAYRHSELKISNAFYKFGYLHIDELGVDRKRLARWKGQQVSKSLRAVLADSALVDLIPVGQRRSFLRGLIERMQQD
jgi:hypothetical protein